MAQTILVFNSETEEGYVMSHDESWQRMVAGAMLDKIRGITLGLYQRVSQKPRAVLKEEMMPVNALRKDLPRGANPLQGETVEGTLPRKNSQPSKEEALLEAELGAKEQAELWEAADNAMTESDGSLRW